MLWVGIQPEAAHLSFEKELSRVLYCVAFVVVSLIMYIH